MAIIFAKRILDKNVLSFIDRTASLEEGLTPLPVVALLL